MYVTLFILVSATFIAYLTVGFWALRLIGFALLNGRPIDSSVVFAVPKPIAWVAEVFPLLIVGELGLFVLFSKRRWKHTPHHVRWDNIPNHNIVVAMTAYNDEQSIYDAVQEFKSQKDVREIIVVDNNSTDRTAELASQAGARVVREMRQGYGYACTRGLAEALKVPKVNVIVLAEGDMTFNGSDLSKLVPYLDNVDMVVGTRTTQELTNDDSQLNWFYVWGNMCLAKMVQIKFFDVKHWGRVRLTDVGCTLRAMRADALAAIIDGLRVGGHHFSPHMLMVSIAKGQKVVEVPVTFRKRRGKSKGASSGKLKGLAIGLRMAWHILSF